MNLDRDLAGTQFTLDLLVEQAGDHQPHHFTLTRSQCTKSLAQLSSFASLSPYRAVALESFLDRIQKIVIAKRLGEELQRAGFHRTHRHRDVAITGDEDDRKVDL